MCQTRPNVQLEGHLMLLWPPPRHQPTTQRTAHLQEYRERHGCSVTTVDWTVTWPGAALTKRRIGKKKRHEHHNRHNYHSSTTTEDSICTCWREGWHQGQSGAAEQKTIGVGEAATHSWTRVLKWSSWAKRLQELEKKQYTQLDKSAKVCCCEWRTAFGLSVTVQVRICKHWHWIPGNCGLARFLTQCPF